MLLLTRATWAQMVGHAYDGLPDEACGLFAGPVGTDRVTAFHACANAAASSLVYSIAPRDLLRIDREVEAAGLQVQGVMHSHTHTDAYPSPTDVAQAPDPGWHYAIVSLRQDHPVLRSYRIVNGGIEEESVSLSDH